MKTHLLLEVLSRMCPLSPEFVKRLEGELIPLSFPKHHLLVESPRVAEFAYFLESGFVMSYTFVDSKKRTENFWKAGEIILLPKSFFGRLPSTETVELMEKGSLLCITLPSVLSLFQEFHEANVICRIALTECYQKSVERIHDLQDSNATRRFKKLLSDFPDIEQIIPQDNIASFLGITPQSLSRVKRRNS